MVEWIGQVRQADCVQAMSEMEVNSIAVVIGDVPYNIAYHSNYYKGRNPHAPLRGDWDFNISSYLEGVYKVLVEGGALYLFCRWDVLPVWMPAVQAAGFKVKTVIVWVKNNWSAGDLTGSFGNQYENILFAAKGRNSIRGKRWPNVWKFPRVPPSQMLVPTQKPAPLLARAIKASSDPGDIVADFTCGSGSTGEAAVECGRRYILCDVDPAMVAIARRRLGLPVEDSEDLYQVLAQLPYSLEPPDPAAFGLHPEDLAALAAMVRDNVGNLFGLSQKAGCPAEKR